jgi:L-ascorbate metabolism protein UlaG (beta-lactamase superfamily)
MEITWFGETCVRFRGREGTVVADAFRSVAGPTGRGLTADVCTYSHADPEGPPRGARPTTTLPAPLHGGLGIVRPTSLEPAFLVDAPGEYEVHEVLITGVRTFRDEARGADRGLNTAFVYELDGLHAVHLGDVGHLLTEEMLGEIGAVQIVCVPLGRALSPARAAELVTSMDATLVVPMPTGDEPDAALATFLKEMNVTHSQPVSKLSVTISTVPHESTVVVLDSRGKA